MATLTEFLAAHVTAANRTAVGEAVAAVGDVSLTVSQLRDPRAFKHVTHPLQDHFEAFCTAAGIDLDAPWEPGTPLPEDVLAVAWELLVEHHLLSRVDVDVTLGASSHNSAYARLVDGLLHNESRLDAVDVWHVTVTGADVAAAFLDACDGARAVPRVSARPSVLTAGLAGLVGRRVEVRFDGDGEDVQSGRLLAVTDDALVLGEECNDGELLVVPRAGVRAVYTYQLTGDEDVAIFPGGGGGGVTDTAAQPAGEARDEHDAHDDAPSADELDAALGSVWQSWCAYRASVDPVAAAFALGAFANELYHYTTDRLGFDATDTNGAPTGGLG